jgi:hypothetical protein
MPPIKLRIIVPRTHTLATGYAKVLAISCTKTLKNETGTAIDQGPRCTRPLVRYVPEISDASIAIYPVDRQAVSSALSK